MFENLTFSDILSEVKKTNYLKEQNKKTTIKG